MSRRTPLHQLHEQAEALAIPYGNPESLVTLVGAVGPIEIEYAAIRRAAGVFDQPHRATLVVTGAERLPFLNRMLTQELKGIEDFRATRAFWLSRKGRIDADLRVLVLPGRVLLDLDVFAAERTTNELNKYIISEDCALSDQSEDWHRLGVHGPASAEALARLSEPVAGAGISDIRPGQVGIIRMAGVEVIVDRSDWAGEIGLELLVRSGDAHAVYEAISEPWRARTGGGSAEETARPLRIGWHALNMARIETGTPLYYTDFGPDSLPAETGVLRERVSFTKGCYLGQEIVARMDALGHPKRTLVGLRVEREGSIVNGAAPEHQAETGTPVLAAGEGGGGEPTVIGGVTSSAVSPMLAQTPVCFAMVKWGHHEPGTEVSLDVNGARLRASVQPSLTFWKR